MAYNWGAQINASANAKKVKQPKEESLYDQQRKALAAQDDMSSWTRVGQGVFGTGGETAESLMTSILGAGDRDATYERVKSYNPSNPGVAAAVQSFVQGVDEERAAAAQMQAAMSGYGGRYSGGQTGTAKKSSSVNYTPSSVPVSVTEEFNRRIRELQNAIQAAGEAGDYTAADLNAQLKQAKADREAAVNKYALNNAMDYYKDRNPYELSDELMQSAKLNNRGQTREVRDLTDLAQARGDEQARTDRLSDLYSQLYEAQGGQGEDAMGRAEAIQREINQLEAAQRAKAQWEANTADYSDSEALEEATRNRVDEYNRYQGMDSVDQMNSRIDSLQTTIDAAESKILDINKEAAEYQLRKDFDPDSQYYQSLERQLARQNADIDNAKQEIDALKKDIENKLAYDASLTPEERQYLEGLSEMLDVVEERNDAVLRAAEVLADAQQDYIDKNREASVANAETRAYSDAYRMRVNQLNALAAQYKSMSRSGASADELQTMYDAVQRAYADTNILGNAAASRHEDAVQAAEERSLAEQTLLGAQNAMGIVSGQLGNAIGRYYDAIYEQFTVPNEYKEAYEQVQGLDVLISGYERKLDNAATAEEVAEYQRRLGELKAERANLFAYAYEYDMSRTLSGLSSRELYELGQIVMFEEDSGAYASGGPDVGGKNRMPNWMRTAASGENILDKIFGALYPNVNKDILSGKYKINSKTGEKELKSTPELLESGTDFAARIREYERKYKEEWGEDKYNSIMAMVRLEADRRHWNEYAAKLKEGSTLESILFAPVSIVTNALSAPGAITEIAVQMLDNVDAPINTYASGFAMQNATRAIRGTASEKIEERITNALGNGVFGQSIAQTASGVFGTMLSMADTMVAAGIGSYTGIPWAGELMLGATAATNAAQEAVDRGDDPAHAVARGIIAGVFESLFEHLSIENIQAMQKAEVLTSVDQLLSNMRKSMISEGSEEFFTEVANLAADAVVWAAGGKSELANRYEEIKQQYKLTDPQANKMIAVELALGLNLPEWGALGLSIAGQTLEAGAGGALMGALFVPMYQGGQLRRYLNAESSVNQALTNMENARGVEKFAKIIDMNYKLPDKYQVELSNFRTGVTTDADLNNMARQVRDAWAKYNADMKKWAQENPDEYNAAMEKRRELESVRLYTVANVDEVNAQAEAGAEAGRADAQTEQTTQNAQEGVRTARNESFAEEGTTTTSAEEEESEAFRAEAESEARTVLSGLESKYSGERLTNEVNREAERLIEQGGTDADRGRALLRIYNGETGGETASVPAASQQRAAVQAPTWAQGMASQDVQTVNSAVGNVVRGATERNGTINTQFAQDIIGDETVRFRASGREDLIAPFNAAVQEAIAGGNENANVHNNENVRRTSGANPAEQSRSVAGSAGEAAGTEGSFAESGEQRRTESGRAGQTGGSERVTETSEAAQTTAVPEGMTDMSELIPGAGKKGNYVRVASSEQGKPGYKRRYRRIAEEARKAGYKVNFVEGGDLVFETENGKTIATNGAINTDTKEIWLRGDDPDFTVEQLFQHELFHGLDEQLKKDIADIVRQEYGPRLNGVIAQYGIYYEGASNDPAYLMEELCADIYAGMNRGGYGQSALTEKVRAAAEAGRTQRETRPEATQTQQETRKGDYETNGGKPAPADISPDYADVKFSVAPPYRAGTNALNEFVDGLDKDARATYDLFATIHNIGNDNKVTIPGTKNPRNITSTYMTADRWNSLCEASDSVAAVAKQLADALPENVRKNARINADGTITETPFEKEFKMERAYIQRIVDALPDQVASSTVMADGKTIRVSNRAKISVIGGEAYRRALVEETRKMYREGTLPTKSIKGLHKDSWGAMGFLAANEKTGASGDFTTFCPQMYFNKGCFYCYRRAALESGVNNKLVGENVWYSGEILRLTKSNVSYLNEKGGLRIQSFGDWMGKYSAQLADLLLDAETVGLQVKIITKEPSMIETVALLKEQGIGNNLYFNLSADYTIEEQGIINNLDTEGASPRNPLRPYMETEDGRVFWKRALSVEEANEFRKKYPWVNTRIVATTVEEFLEGLRSPYVDVVTGYHGKIREFERVSSATGETLLQVEALGDNGMPVFSFDTKTKTWSTEYEGRTKTHKKLARAIEDAGLQLQYYIKTCCITGRCAECNGKCGKIARDFNVKNATNADAASVAYWQKEMVSAEDNPLLLDQMEDAQAKALLDAELARNQEYVPPKANPEDYIRFSMSSRSNASATEAEQDEDNILQLRDDIESITDQLDLADVNGLSEREQTDLRNQLVKAQHDLDELTAKERRLAKKTPVDSILENLDRYRRTDLESLAEQVSDGAWDEYEELSDDELRGQLRETIEEIARDLSPLERQAAKFGYSVRPVESLRFSRATRDDINADIDAGYAADEDAEEPNSSAKIGSVAGGKLLDERARDAYDAALANGDRELADKIRKQRAAEDKARGLYREINMERKAYNADGNVDHLNRANSLMAEARDARREARKLAESTRLDVESQYTPTQAIKRTENNLMSTYSIKRGERAKTRTRIRNVLNDAYLNGYVDYSTAYRLLSDMYDISTDYIAPDPAYDDIHRDLRGKHVYVSPQVRALFGDEWNQIRREYYSYGIYLTTSRNTADITIGEAYERNAEKYPGILNPTVGEAYDDERIYNLLSALQLSEGADVSLGEAAEMKNIGATEDFGSRLDKAFGILKEFADAANIEVRGKAKADMNTLQIRTRFEEKERLARERRAHAAVYDKVQRELDRIYKRAKVNQQNKVRLASEQNAAIRESMEDMFDDLNEVAKSIMGDDVDLTNLLGIVEWLKKTSNEKAGFDALGWDESTGGQLAQDVDKLAKFMNGKELNIEELQDLLDILRTIEHHLKLVNEMSESNFESLGGAAPQLTQDLLSIKRKSTKALKVRHLLNEDSLSYSRNLKRYSDWNPHGVMYHMAENLEKGDMNYMAYREGADLVLMPFLERRNNEKRRAWLATAAGKNAKLTELTFPAAQITGRGDASISETVKVKVNQMQLVQMYLDLRNEDNVRHVENGGYTFLDSELHKEGKDTDAAKRGVIIKMSADQMQDITDRYLDDTGKEFADLLFQYYNEYAKPLINNVSRAIDGRDRAVTSNYYPIRVDTGMGIPDSYNVFRGSLEGMGPLTERNSGASNAILLIDADQTFQWHKEMMARYVGYAKPLRDLRTLLNYTEGGRKNSDLLTEKFTSNAETLMHDLFGMLETAQFEKAKTLSTIFGNYISNVLTANISSMLKQFAALPLAGTSFGMEPIMYALSPKGMATKIDTDLIRKYTSYLDDRAAGIVYDQITDIVRGGNRISGQVGSARYITWQTALGRNWLGAADYWANKQMWVAAQHYVDTHTNLRPGTQAEIDAGKDLYYQKVAEVFNRMTFDTQTNSNMMSKPNILRRVDSGIKAFTLFKTDAFQIYGITREILGQMRWANQNGDAQDKHDAKLKVLHGIEGIVGASVVQSVMKYIAEFIRRRDKDYKGEDGNWDWKVFGKRVGLDTLENMTNMMAFGEEVYSLIMSVIDKDTKWYDKETAALDAINQLVSSITTNLPKLMTFFEKMSAAEDKMAYFESNIDSFATPFKKLAMQIAAFFGVPASNYEKNLIAALGWIYPDAAAALQSFGKATQKSDITNKSELKAYMKDQVGELSNEAIDAYWTLYEAFGKEALPGFGEPQMKDENGKDRDMTDEEFTKWDYAYRVAMIDAVNSVVGSEAFNGLTDDEKERALSMAADYAKQVGREAVGLDNPKWYGYVQNAISYGAELGNVLTWYKLRGNTQAEKFAALERMDVPDEQKAAILHGMYEDISTAAAWATAADSMTDMQFLEFTRDKLATKLAELDTVLPGSVGDNAPTLTEQPVETPAPVETQTVEQPVQEEKPASSPEADALVSAGMSKASAQKVSAAIATMSKDSPQHDKWATASLTADSVEDQLAAIRYYADKNAEANYQRFSTATKYDVTPATFFEFYVEALNHQADHALSQADVKGELANRPDLSNEQKAAIWQLCGAGWAARNNPYDTAISGEIKSAYDSNKG